MVGRFLTALDRPSDEQGFCAVFLALCLWQFHRLDEMTMFSGACSSESEASRLIGTESGNR
jgi:hypothetical protein